MNKKLWNVLILLFSFIFIVGVAGCASEDALIKDNAPTQSIRTSEQATPENTLSQTTEDKEVTVYVTNSGTKYHREGCRYLSKSKIAVPLSEAVEKYSPCSVCDPPTLNSSNSISSNTTTSSNISSEPLVTKPVDQSKTASETETKGITVYITKTGEKYHRANCQYLRKSKIAISLSDAKADGYTPCSKCNPPN